MLRHFAFVGRLGFAFFFALLGWLGIRGHGALAHDRVPAALATEEKLIADRMERARERLNAVVADPAAAPGRMAQWYNWNNWANNWNKGWRNF